MLAKDAALEASTFREGSTEEEISCLFNPFTNHNIARGAA